MVTIYNLKYARSVIHNNFATEKFRILLIGNRSLDRKSQWFTPLRSSANERNLRIRYYRRHRSRSKNSRIALFPRSWSSSAWLFLCRSCLHREKRFMQIHTNCKWKDVQYNENNIMERCVTSMFSCSRANINDASRQYLKHTRSRMHQFEWNIGDQLTAQSTTVQLNSDRVGDHNT